MPCKLIATIARAPSSTSRQVGQSTHTQSNANAVARRPNTAAYSSSWLAAGPTACQRSSGMAWGLRVSQSTQHNYCMQPQGCMSSRQQTTYPALDLDMHQQHAAPLKCAVHYRIYASLKSVSRWGIKPPYRCKDYGSPNAKLKIQARACLY